MSIIILDRDGVLNKLVINPMTQEVDSPMTMAEIEVFPWVPACLKRLNNLGFALAVATNQPAAAKGKIDLKDLTDIHRAILEAVQAKGGVISNSQMCIHKKEDKCWCRKPKIGMLEAACLNYNKYSSWIVGDRATDIIAGSHFGIKTALIGKISKEDFYLLQDLKIQPTFYGTDLKDFTNFISR